MCEGKGPKMSVEFVGIDVSKAWLDVAWRPSEEQARFGNDESGIAELTDRLRRERPTLVVLEATGGYQTAVVTSLALAGIAVAVAHQLAQAPARRSESRDPRERSKYAGVARERRSTAERAGSRASRQRDVAVRAARAGATEPKGNCLAGRLGAVQSRQRQVIGEAFGVGRAGTSAGRAVHGTLSATKHNPIIRMFYQRLISAGKPFKLALTACMRKLLTILNSMVKATTRWEPVIPKLSE